MSLVYTRNELKRRVELRERTQKWRRLETEQEKAVKALYRRPRSEARSVAIKNGKATLYDYRRTLKEAENELAKFYAGIAAKQTEKVNKRGLNLIIEFEGFYARPYNDPVGYSTVGVGHLIAYRPVNDADKRAIWVPGQDKPGVLTYQEGLLLLDKDLDGYEKAVRDAIGPKLSPNEFSACVSLCYNIGPGGFASSSVAKYINQGRKKAAADAFRLWVRGGGQVLPGLVRRREAERRLFLTK